MSDYCGFERSKEIDWLFEPPIKVMNPWSSMAGSIFSKANVFSFFQHPQNRNYFHLIPLRFLRNYNMEVSYKNRLQEVCLRIGTALPEYEAHWKVPGYESPFSIHFLSSISVPSVWILDFSTTLEKKIYHLSSLLDISSSVERIDDPLHLSPLFS